jgi:ABC-type multidrug transport system ATPase subunit
MDDGKPATSMSAASGYEHLDTLDEPPNRKSPFWLMFSLVMKLQLRPKFFWIVYFVVTMVLFGLICLLTVPTFEGETDPGVGITVGSTAFAVFSLVRRPNVNLGIAPNTTFLNALADGLRFAALAANVTQPLTIHSADNIEDLVDKFWAERDFAHVGFSMRAAPVPGEGVDMTLVTKNGWWGLGVLAFTILESAAREFLSAQTGRGAEAVVSVRKYAHPPQRTAESFSSISIYILADFIVIAFMVSSVIFNLNKTRLLFYIRISGVSSIVMGCCFVVVGLLEVIPASLLLSIAICFISPPCKGSDFGIVWVSMLLFTIGQWFYLLTAVPVFLKFNVSAVLIPILLVVPVARVIMNIWRDDIADGVYLFLDVVFPQFSFLESYSLFSELRFDYGPLGTSTMAVTYASLNLNLVFLFQVINIILWAVAMVIVFLHTPRRFGLPPLGSRFCFQFKKLFRSRFEIHNQTNAVVAQNIRREYKGARVNVVALDDVSFELTEHELIVLIGPNGAGKSTLIDVLIGVQHVDEGSVSIYGRDVTDDFTAIYARMGIVFQENTLIDLLTVEEHFQFFGDLHGIPQQTIEQQTDTLTSMLELTDSLTKRAADLSGGQKRKLCLALALLHRPMFIILDEPTSGVDVQSRQVIWRTLGLCTGATSVVTAHSLEEAESVCSRLFVLRSGKLLFQGSPAELRQRTKCGYMFTVTEGNVDRDALLAFVREVIPEAEWDADRDDRVLLPDDLRVADVLERLEPQKERLGILKYTIHVSNLEESLVKIVQEAGPA